MEKGCCGYCNTCNCEHFLPIIPAREACLELMNLLQREKRIDFSVPANQADFRYSTDYLEGPARGKMFGVMVAKTAGGRQRVFRAFSGQYNGIWKVPGWVDPVFDLARFHKVHDHREKEIKELGQQIQEVGRGGPACQSLAIKRKHKSQQLMKKIHELYRLKNFCTQEAGLAEIFSQGRGIPTGTGDCCAPKLLQYAAVNNLRPVSIAEFYWGRENLSGTRQHGSFYPSCQSKCYPILGFMLCGLTSEHND
jgi:hypothetical protein